MAAMSVLMAALVAGIGGVEGRRSLDFRSRRPSGLSRPFSGSAATVAC